MLHVHRALGSFMASHQHLFEDHSVDFESNVLIPWLLYICRPCLSALQVLFAFEEAIGFMLGGMYKDKDGVSAAAVFAEMSADLYAHGTSLGQHLQDLYKKYGYFTYRANYFIADQPHKSRAVFDRLRNGGNYPKVRRNITSQGLSASLSGFGHHTAMTACTSCS